MLAKECRRPSADAVSGHITTLSLRNYSLMVFTDQFRFTPFSGCAGGHGTKSMQIGSLLVEEKSYKAYRRSA
jgi:hypothetical protein